MTELAAELDISPADALEIREAVEVGVLTPVTGVDSFLLFAHSPHLQPLIRSQPHLLSPPVISFTHPLFMFPLVSNVGWFDQQAATCGGPAKAASSHTHGESAAARPMTALELLKVRDTSNRPSCHLFLFHHV